ncbi:MAG: S8 family serine peptidase [Firmicutes bacterium]|nr:S8 family serine peptidase [Bacillota bacterium]
MKKRIILVIGVFVVIISAGVLMWQYSISKYPEHIFNMNIDRLWNESQGENIVIAFLDSGMHQKLADVYGERVVDPYDFVNDREVFTDTNGHGTALICIETCKYEDTGVYGIAPQAKVMPLRIFDSNGNTSDERIVDAIRYAVDNGADIINMSFGSYEESIEVENVINYAYLNNVFVICSAGEHITYSTAFPAKNDKTIGIGDKSDYEYGVGHEDIDFFLEGNNIPSLRFSDSENDLIFNTEKGSSVSTAMFSGIIALKISNMQDIDKIEFLIYLFEDSKIYSIIDIINY